MRTRMLDTSLDAYYSTVLPNISKRQKAVLKVFTDNQAMTFTNLELADELGWKINCVTGRTHELRGLNPRYPMKEPVLIKSGRRKSRRNKLRRPLTLDPIYSKLDHNAWTLNPHWKPGGYKID